MAQKASDAADALYAVLAARYAAKPAAGQSKGFGSNALKVNGKIFASLSRGRLLVKLPEARVDLLIKSKKGLRFSTGVSRKNGSPSGRPPRRNGWRSPTRRGLSSARK
jgi:hypothetical protein